MNKTELNKRLNKIIKILPLKDNDLIYSTVKKEFPNSCELGDLEHDPHTNTYQLDFIVGEPYTGKPPAQQTLKEHDKYYKEIVSRMTGTMVILTISDNTIGVYVDTYLQYRDKWNKYHHYTHVILDKEISI